MLAATDKPQMRWGLVLSRLKSVSSIPEEGA